MWWLPESRSSSLLSLAEPGPLRGGPVARANGAPRVWAPSTQGRRRPSVLATGAPGVSLGNLLLLPGLRVMRVVFGAVCCYGIQTRGNLGRCPWPPTLGAPNALQLGQ